MALIKTKEQIETLKEGGKILADVLRQVKDAAQVGVTPKELDELAGRLIAQYNAKPSFKGFQGYPAVLCVSVNEQLVHGIPTDKPFQPGDVVGIDCGLWYKGLCTDMAITVIIGQGSKIAEELVAVTKQSLAEGLKEIKAGKRLGDYGSAVQNYVEAHGFSVIRGLVGHGVGTAVHEEPRVPNFGQPGSGEVLQAGMVLALEPMVSVGSPQIITEADGWTISTRDRSLSAHFEVTVAVTDEGYDLITPIIW